MRAFAVAVLLLFALVGASVLLWLGSASSAAPPVAPAPAPASQASAAPGVAPASTIPIARNEVAANDERVATPTPTPKPRQGIEEVGAAPVGVDFTSKYHNSAREKLLDRLTQLESDLERDSAKLFVERFEANAFTTQPIAANDARKIEEIVESLTTENELCSTRLVFGDITGRDMPNMRPHAVQMVCLRRAEFPDLYSLVDERDWLRDLIARTPPTDK